MRACARRGRRRKKTFCNKEKLNAMGGDTRKKAEHIYPVMNPAQFNQAVTPISSV